MSSPTPCRRQILLSAVSLVLPDRALAADTSPEWPGAKPITWLVGFPAGGSVDVLTRVAARELAQKTGLSVLVENRPGASGALALAAAAKAAPDGYTLVTVPGPGLHRMRMPELGQELMAVSLLAQGPMVLVGGTQTGPSTLPELLAAIKKDSQAWSYASSGTGTGQHLAGELMNVLAGTRVAHVPYKGGSQAVTDVVGNQLPLGFLGVSPVLSYIKAGRLKAYAVTSTYRSESLPEVPTMHEAGLSGYNATQWYAIGAPRGTSQDVLTRLNGWLNEIVASPAMKPSLLASGSIAGKGTPREVQAFCDADTLKWKNLAAKVGLTLD